MHIKFNPIHDSLERLRQDAIARHMGELAIAYGWSLIKIKEEVILGQIEILKLMREERQNKDGCGNE